MTLDLFVNEESLVRMFAQLNLRTLRHHPRIAFYFRYPLRYGDFHELYEHGHLLGRFAVKPLYGRLTKTGKVDHAAGFNGRLAIIFIPARARTSAAARLILTQMPPKNVTLTNGRRNWPAIRSAAEKAVRRAFARAVQTS